MKLVKLSVVLTAIAFVLTSVSCLGADQITLELKKSGSQVEVGLRSQMALPVSAMYPEYTILRSTNLQTWQPVAGPISGGVGVSDELLRVAVPLAGDHAFYRVVANVKLAPAGNSLGDAIYGYGTEFNRELQRLGQLPLEDFVTMYGPTNQYLPQISFDPKTAEFWDQFNLDPAVHNATNSADPRLTDFRLNTNELAVFETNGFVVSPRLGSYSFADAFYKIYIDDLPVFVSCDAILHAWHRSYVTMLQELEETLLIQRLTGMIANMSAQVATLNFRLLFGDALVRNGVADAGDFLAVAQSLITGTSSGNANANATIAIINNLQPASINIFGTSRFVDFSQFRVRGHYEASTALSNYFRAVMWCNLVDFRFTGSTNDNSLRELAGATAMAMLMDLSGEFTNWLQFDNVVQMFVGPPDSLNLAQLVDLLAAGDIHTPTNSSPFNPVRPSAADLQNLQAQLMSGQLGVQNIRSGYFWSPLSRQQLKLPRSFTFIGQRFVPDSWALSKVVFDDIIWDEDGISGFEDKVMRRVPSALDVAFSVLGNCQIVPEIAARISRTNLTPADGRPYWRDGRKYQHNLAAVRNAVDSQGLEAWTNNIYTSWLDCLRELSTPTTDAQYPQAMRTRPWALKTLNTQLASWTELRHDTVLYAKQSSTGLIICSYPIGFVEPRPEFWRQMKEVALRSRSLLAELPTNGVVQLLVNDFGSYTITVSLAEIYAKRLAFMDRFAGTMATLQSISEKELIKTPLSPSETGFLQDLMETQVDYNGTKRYNRWYPNLFYRDARTQMTPAQFQGSDMWDPLVTDVHTDPAEPVVGDPGSILHEGVGNVHLLLIAIDCGPGDLAVYAGPVLSHYEFELGPTTRKTDSQWKAEIRAGTLPTQPDWTRGYLVPGPYTVPNGAQ